MRPPILDDVTPASPQPSADGLVYATLGTVFNVESGDRLGRLTAALSMLDRDALLTTGHEIARAELPTPGARLRVEQFVAQRNVFGTCRAVVCHGGSGTLLAALSCGIPVILLPLGADQPDNADRCLELGLGVVLDATTVTPTEIADAVETVIGDQRFTQAAAALASEAQSQPRLDELEELTQLLDRSS